MAKAVGKREVQTVSFAEIVNELPKLNRQERRELARRLFDFPDEDAAILADSDRRADERFLMLEAIEEEDGKAEPR
jgi:hypothetical protein